MTETVASKYQLTTTPPLPSSCVGCLKVAKGVEKFIDSGTSIDYFGSVVFCSDCIREMAMLLGMAPVAQTVEVVEMLSRAMEELNAEKQKVEVLERVVFTYGIDCDTPDPEPSADVLVSEDEQPREEVPKESEPGPFE